MANRGAARHMRKEGKKVVFNAVADLAEKLK
jgi:hypothetical protein